MKEEKLYECEVKRPFILDGERVTKWTVKPVLDLLDLKDPAIRCKDCHGAVKLLGKKNVQGTAPHAVHKSKQDSEYCPSGMYFRQAKDGRVSRWSESPVA